jgi:hypothetical protein
MSISCCGPIIIIYYLQKKKKKVHLDSLIKNKSFSIIILKKDGWLADPNVKWMSQKRKKKKKTGPMSLRFLNTFSLYLS